jgi:hypothetical protein
MAMLSWLSPVFGSKPDVAPFDFLNLTEEQRKAIAANIANMPKIEELGNMFQQFYLDQMDTAFGGTGIFRSIMESGGRTTQEMLDQSEQMLRGEIPKDVKDQVMRSSAYQSLMGGYSGGTMAGANAARNLGLTSLNMITQGATLAGAAGNAAQRWASLSGAAGTPGAGGVTAGMLITPQQQAAFDMQQAMIKHNLKQQKENIKAARDPVIGGLSDLVETLTAAYLGSLGGGGGGGTQKVDNSTDWSSNVSQGTGGTPTSQYGGVVGSISNFLGGNLHTGSSSVPSSTGGYSTGAASPVSGLSKETTAVNNVWDLPAGINQSDLDQVGDTGGYPWAMGGPVGTTALAGALYGIQGSTFNQPPPPAGSNNWWDNVY